MIRHPLSSRRVILAWCLAGLGCWAIQASPAVAQQPGGVAFQIPEVHYFVGLGAGVIPDYVGSNDYTAAIAPMFFIKFGDSDRYARLLGTEFTINLIDSEEWNLGPILYYRFGRKDVEDSVIDRMSDIDGAAELGLFGGWTWIDEADARHRFNVLLEVLQDVSGTHGGCVTALSARYWQPVARFLVFTLGVSGSYASEKFMSTYFGVDRIDSAASGLPNFEADRGFRDFRLTPGFVFSLNPHWHIVGGLIYSRLLADAEDSPVVSVRGTPDQFTAGAGLAYAW